MQPPGIALGVSLVAMCAIVALRYVGVSALCAWLARRLRPEIYAPADPARAARLARQIRHEVGWSLLAAVLYGLPAGLVAHMWATRGWTMIYTDPRAWPLWWMPVSLLLYLAIHDCWFYWTHRAMHHWPWLFRHAHAVHHQSRPPTAWAAMAFHPWEALSAACLIPALTFLIPIHAAVLGLVLAVMTFFGVTNHMGWEVFPARWIRGLLGRHLISGAHHQIHHERYNHNYGLYFRFWDRLCGTDAGLSEELLLAREGVSQAPPPQ